MHNGSTNYNVSSLNVAFTAADDGARAYIFNSAHPNGAFIGEISLGGSPTSQNYASLSVAGEINRLVIVQFDDCPSGNNLTGAKVKVNGNVVAINTGGCTTSNFFWSDAPTVSGKTATGTINGIGYTYSSDVSFTTTSNLFGHNKFPSQYNIPNQISIRNDYASNNTLKFNKPMTNPVLVFASIGGGQPSPTVSIQFQDNFSVVWAESGTTTVDLNAKKVTGTEGNIIIRFDGTFTELNFSYLNAESWVNFAFGADFSTTSPDTIAPTITLNGSTAQSINAFTTYTDSGATITDNCDTNPAILVSGTVNSNIPGTYNLTYTGVDASGNTSAPLTRVVTVVNPVPTAICKPITVYLDASGKAIITPQQVDNGSNSSVGISNMSLSKTAFDCTNIGTNTVTLTVTSSLGATATCNAIVTVVDNIVPVITVPADINVFATSAQGVVVSYTTPVGTDNCSATTAMTAGLASGATFPLGTTIITYTATDASGNTASASFNVKVTGVAPKIVSPGDITVSNDLGQCGAKVNYAATETVGIPASVITYDIAPSSTFANGTTTVTATATNVIGSSSVSFNVTVNDTEKPTVITQPLSVSLDANGAASITAAQINNNSTDNCTIKAMTLDVSSFTCANVGPNTVTLTVTDASGNAISATAVVNVVDSVPPVVLTNNITLELDATGNASITTTDIDNGSNDACGIASLALSMVDFTCANLGPNTVVLTVTDVNGNIAKGNAIVTVVDVTAPVITASIDPYKPTNNNDRSYNSKKKKKRKGDDDDDDDDEKDDDDHKDDKYVIHYSAEDACGLESLVGVIEIPTLINPTVKLKISDKDDDEHGDDDKDKDKGDDDHDGDVKEEVKINFKKNEITIKSPNPQALYSFILANGGVSVANGDIIKFKDTDASDDDHKDNDHKKDKKKKSKKDRDDDNKGKDKRTFKMKIKNGKIVSLEASSMVLNVTAIDGSGNTSTLQKTLSTNTQEVENDENDDEDVNLTISLYPNPSSGSFNIQLDNINSKAKINIYSFYGRLIQSKKADPEDGKAIVRMGGSKLRNGQYIVKVYYENKIYTKVMVINK